MIFNKVIFNPINSTFHTYYVEGLHDYLLSFNDLATNTFLNKKEERFRLGKYNAPTPEGELKNNLLNLYNKILNDFYYIGDLSKSYFGGLGISYQDDKLSNSTFHNHWKASLVSTVYINPPETPSFEIWNPPQDPIHITLQKNTLYFLPNWMLHRATPQQTKTPRICFNWTYITQLRPIHKLTGDRW